MNQACGGFTVIEVVLAMAVTALAAAAAVTAWGGLEGLRLTRAAAVAESHLRAARLRALSARERLDVTVSGTIVETRRKVDGFLVARTDLAEVAMGGADSVALRPATLRFNARGHGAAGSLYLYRDERGIRLISNFLGRVRREKVSR